MTHQNYSSHTMYMYNGNDTSKLQFTYNVYVQCICTMEMTHQNYSSCTMYMYNGNDTSKLQFMYNVYVQLK